MQDLGVGKTTLALQIADNLIANGKHVMFCSLEMASSQLIYKIISRRTGVNSYVFRSGNISKEDKEEVIKVAGEMTQSNLQILEDCYTINKIISMATKRHYQKKLDVLIIDYLQLVRCEGNYVTREREVAEITRSLKLLTLKLKIPVIALCQLNRNAENREPRIRRFKRIRKY